MTVCIAAICQMEDRQDAIVLCTDLKTGSALGSAETALKQRPLGDGWVCLTSGYESDILALFDHLSRARGVAVIDERNIINIIRSGILGRKKEKIEEYIIGKYAISYDEFLKVGKERFPPDAFRDAMQHISNITLRAEFVIAGFAGPFAFLCQTSEEGTSSIREDFAVAGEGGYLATAALLQREQSCVMPLAETLYNVYEAKRFAEKVPSVGDATRIGILTQDGRQRISLKGRAWLKELYNEYGPKQLDGRSLNVPSGCFDEGGGP